ncbi:hypothetical protein S245_044821, partial [Arachis hypogaea]
MVHHHITTNLSAQTHDYHEKATLARKERSSKIAGRRQLSSTPNNKESATTIDNNANFIDLENFR